MHYLLFQDKTGKVGLMVLSWISLLLAGLAERVFVGPFEVNRESSITTLAVFSAMGFFFFVLLNLN